MPLLTRAEQLVRESRRVWHNLTRLAPRARLVIIRERGVMAHYNDHFLSWVARRHPDVHRRFELRRVPRLGRLDLDATALVVPWLQDPLSERAPTVFAEMREIEERCRQAGVPTFNPVAALSNSIKSRAARLIRDTGTRTPHMVPIDDPARFRRDQDAMPLPYFVRQDHGHGGPMLLVAHRDDLAKVPLESIAHPVAVEFIDVRRPDGLYCKWRYVACGDRGVRRHQVVSRQWVVHAADRVPGAAARHDELVRCLVSDPHHDALQRARRALELDFVAFDYSLDRDGRLVIWEPNPLPTLWAGFNHDPSFAYQAPLIERVYRLLLDELLTRAHAVARP